METTFISIHDLGDDARILYSSDSVVDILGYTPEEIVNRSAWDFFPPDELPYIRQFHQKEVSMDKAAVLAYCRVKEKSGGWVGCECCFTIVHDVMVVCTSVYKRGAKSYERALEAPIVRRIFSASPRDPRYHMLSHLSTKFAQPAKMQLHEPRAVMFLNRFTRTLTIMYATSGVLDIIGIPAADMRGRSFYYCVAENCLQDAIKCLERAKCNDSIAYLRFWFRDPRQDDPPEPSDDSDEEMTTYTSTDESDGDVHARDQIFAGHSNGSNAVTSPDSADDDTVMSDAKTDSRTSSDASSAKIDTHEAIFGQARATESSTSSSPEFERRSSRSQITEAIELEAVISCSSDGLVVCLRRARPMVPLPVIRSAKALSRKKGLFAAPWASKPILPPVEARPEAGPGKTFASPLGLQREQHKNPLPQNTRTGPDQSGFMNAIRDQAIFAWALTGINGALAELTRGKPYGESLPRDGVSIWASDSTLSSTGAGNVDRGRAKGEKFGSSIHSPQDGRPSAGIFGDPGLDRKDKIRS